MPGAVRALERKDPARERGNSHPVRERRVAIITGASSGIGRALVERAVRAGWDVFAVGRRAERLAELERLLATAMGRIETIALDVREPAAARRIVRATLERFGRLDVLVNCAGGTAVGRITEQNDEALYEQMETHVIVPLALAREAMPSLRASKGLVIFFGSGVARIPVGTLGAYPPAKAAVRSMARVARNELAADGVAVTYVDPGAVATEFMTRVGFAGPPASIAASPYDVARAVFAAFTSRAPVVNAVPWQTFFVALGEALPRLTDAILARAPGLVGGDPTLPPMPEKTALPIPSHTLAEPDDTAAETSITPIARDPHSDSDRDDGHASAGADVSPDVVPEITPAGATDDSDAARETSTLEADDAFASHDANVEHAEHDTYAEHAEHAEHDDLVEPGADVPEELLEHPSTVQTLLVTAPPAHEAANAAIDAMLSGAEPPPGAATSPAPAPSTFAGALEPHLARMKKLNLRTTYVRDLLVPKTELDLGYVAMRWAGMPNKNERGLTSDVLESLADAGFLERVGRERYRVTRAPDAETQP